MIQMILSLGTEVSDRLIESNERQSLERGSER